MHGKPEIDLDALMEEALAGEPFLQAPIDFHRKVEKRVRIAALRDRERVRFRRSMLSLAVVFLGVHVGTAVFLWMTNLNVLGGSISGGWGTYDSYATSLRLFLSESNGGAYTLLASLVLAAGTFFVGLYPARTQRRWH